VFLVNLFRLPSGGIGLVYTCTFLEDRAVITYGRSVLGEPEVISRTYGMDFRELADRLGFELVEGTVKTRGDNKVRVLPIEWFYT